jgi:hypothetical protein
MIYGATRYNFHIYRKSELNVKFFFLGSES